MAEPVKNSDPFTRTQGIAALLKNQGVFAPTALTQADILKQRQLVSGLPGLEPADYSKQLEESQNQGKLQLALALAQRGFAAAGATPKRGESSISTLSRELFSPLAGDAGAVAGRMMQQRSALKAAEKADKARLSQAALTMTQQRLGQEDAARDKRFSFAQSLVKRDYSPTNDLQRKVGGKWVDFVGFNYTDKVTNLPAIAGVNKEGKLEEIPIEDLRYYRKPAAVTVPKSTGAKLIDRVTRFPVRNSDGSIKEWRSVNLQQVQQIIPTPGNPTVEFGDEYYPLGSERPMKIRAPDGKGGFTLRNPMEGVDFVSTDKDSYDAPKETKYYIKPGLNATDFAAARNLLGSKDLKLGEGIVRWTFRHKVDPELSKNWFDVKGGAANLTPDQANKYLQTEKPKIEEPFPEGGKPFGTTTKAFTVTEIDPVTKKRTQKTIQAVAWLTAPGVFKWKEIGGDGKFLAEKYQGQAWETITDDAVYQSLRPVLDQAFKSAVGLRTNLESDVLTRLGKQVLTQADLKRLAPLKEEERTEALNDIINARIRTLTGETPEVVTTVPSEVLQLDPRVKAMATVPEGSTSLTRSVVNPRILQPWTRGGKNIQLGTGSHPGFLQVSSKDVLGSRRNFPGIKQAFEQIYGGARNIGDAEERILLFSGLWKNLPGVAKGQNATTLSDSAFRTAFDKAAAQYNKAAKEFTPAAGLNIGKGAQAKNLQGALDDDTDALRDNVIMLRFKDQGGAWFSDGTWLAEMRGSGLGELLETWGGNDGTARDETYAAMPSNKWSDIAKPDSQLNKADLNLKRRAFAFLKEKSKDQNQKGAKIGLDEFEKAAEYLGALSRYKIRAFSMIQDSRPSDKDIEILLAAFVGNRDSNTTTFAKLHELQNRHVNSLNRNINRGISLNAVFDPVFLADLDHTSRALQRSSVRDVDPRQGGRAEESAKLFRRSSDTIRRAAEAASGRIIPGNRGGAISPMSGNVDEASTANLYRRVVSAAQEAYPDKKPQEAVTEFVRQGLHLNRFLGVYGTSRTAAPAVQESNRTFTIR
jgi:hypothetical protein